MNVQSGEKSGDPRGCMEADEGVMQPLDDNDVELSEAVSTWPGRAKVDDRGPMREAIFDLSRKDIYNEATVRHYLLSLTPEECQRLERIW